MYVLSTCYIALMLCVSISLCKKHFIIETKEPDQDDIQTDIVPLYNEGSSGDYGGFHDCTGVGLLCKAPDTDTIVEDGCIFK